MPILQSIRRLFTGTDRSQQKRQVEWLNARLRRVNASYDAARGLDEFARYWSAADRLDADSANSKEVRHTLIARSRYEMGNNGIFDGIAQTYVNDLVGVGPALRMQTNSTPFNQMVEREFRAWSQEVNWPRKLWCMAHAKHVDGEGFIVLRRNPRINHPVKLEPCLYEAEQIQTPYPPVNDPNYIDGIKFDRYGVPISYDVLKQHPGTNRGLIHEMDPEQVPARFMLHWFKMRRPGQHRGIPEMASTLNLGAAARRFREANLLTAEKIARWTLLLKSMYDPATLEEADEVDPLATLELVSGMMSMLPNTVEPVQLRAEHPSPEYGSFVKSLVNEQARPKNMPLNKALCNSADYNYASGRLDHQTYYAYIDVERDDCDASVNRKLFVPWFDQAIFAFGWLGGNPLAVGAGARQHGWDWPKHRVADVEAEANANETRLKSGQVGLRRLYSDQGLDLDDEIAEMATTYGVSEQEVRKRLFDVILPAAKTAEAPRSEPSQDEIDQRMEAAIRNRLRRNGATNGSSNHHALT